jgi:hypothetical protein
MTDQNEFNPEIFKPGEKPRAQMRLPQESYIQLDQWAPYLGYDQYIWWRKFHTWVNRRPDRLYDQHIPYTLESVFEKLGVSKSHFYKKIKVMWESGLIDLVEFAPSQRKTTKPRNIIVYEYPFNDARYEYLPLEKRRDWATEYESESKKHGYKGALKAREIKGLQTETVQTEPFSPVDESPISVDNPVENSPVDNVDNLDNKGLQTETVEGLQTETVRVSEQRPNHYSNNHIHSNNNIYSLSNNSLSKTKISLIHETLKIFDFKEGERETIIELIINRGLVSVSKQDIIEQAKYMAKRPDIRNRPWYFVNGLKLNEGRIYAKPKPNQADTDQEAVTTPLPFYSWLES